MRGVQFRKAREIARGLDAVKKSPELLKIVLYFTGDPPYIKNMNNATFTALQTVTYSEAAEGFIRETHTVMVGTRVGSSLRAFFIDGREVAVQLPRGTIVGISRAFKRAEEISEVQS